MQKKNFLRKILQVATIGLLLATLLGYFGNLYVGFELLSHFKPYYLILAFAIAPLVFFQNKRRYKILIIATLLFNIYEVLPWYLPSRAHASTESIATVKMLSVNVKFNNADQSRVEEFIKKESPAVVMLQELNPTWEETLENLKTVYPYGYIEDPKNNFGVGILSVLPMENIKVINVEGRQTPSLEADIEVADGYWVKVIAIHPVPPITQTHMKNRNKMFAKIARMARESNLPVVIAGDFNTTMWSPAYKKLVKESGLSDGARGRGLYGSWPYGDTNYKNFTVTDELGFTDWIPKNIVNHSPVKLPLDHVLVSDNLLVNSFSTGEDVGSDHLPVVFEVSLATYE